MSLSEKGRIWLDPIVEDKLREPRLDLAAAIEEAATGRAVAESCFDCLSTGTIPCPDGFLRCEHHANLLAKTILVRAARTSHCTSPAQKKARAKRRRARKAAR